MHLTFGVQITPMKNVVSRIAFLFTCVVLLPALNTTAQITMQRAYGGTQPDYGYCIRPTFDSGYVLTGATSSFNAGFYDIFLIKLDKYYNVQWSRVYGDGPLQGNNQGYETIQTTDSGFVIACYSNLSTFGDGTIIRTDKQGNVIWTRTTAEPNNDALFSVVQTQDGNIVALGRAVHGLNNDDVLLVKMDTSGNLIWKKSFGGAGYDKGYKLIELQNGDLVMAGTTSTYGAGWFDTYVIRTDSGGTVLWTKTYGDTSDQEAQDIKRTSDGGFIISGTSFTSNTGGDIYLIKTDSAGTLQWSKTYDGTDGDFGYEVIESPHGGYAVACSTFSYTHGAMLLRVDNGGNFLWSRGYGDPMGMNDFHAILPAADGGYVMAGSVYIYQNDVHLFVVKTDSLGNSGCMQQNIFPLVANAPTQTGSGVTMTTNSLWNIDTLITVNPTAQVTTFCLMMDVHSATGETAVALYPNPVTDHTFTISEGPRTGTLTVFNQMGQVVHTQQIVSYPAVVNLPSALASGIYFVEISGAEQTARTRVVIE